jgi:hypothetical protein
VTREWAAQVGLFVYFPVLVLMTDGIDLLDRERFKRFVIWRKYLKSRYGVRAPLSCC